jgi:hypothetical protein
MSTATDLYEVLLIHAAGDEVGGQEVREALVESGFSVVSSLDIVRSEKLVGERLRKAIIGADAVVFIFSPASSDALLLIQLGAASALDKSIFVIRSGVSVDDLPTFAKRFPSFPISHLDEIVASLRKQQRLDASDWEFWKSKLIPYYRKYGPLDELENDYPHLDKIARRMSGFVKRDVSPDEVFYKLLRMKRLGQLPATG